RLVEVGELTEEKAEVSERRNIILQALGPDPVVRVDLSWQALQREDVLIICSDGLSTMVRRDDIAQAVREEKDLSRMCQRLVDLANERGGPDNITVVIVRFEGDALPADSTDAPGYHEMVTTAERPALRPTGVFASGSAPAAVVIPALPPSRTGPLLTVIAVAIAIIGLVVWLSR
ncbi:MAG TPA: hypothetical protein VHW65_09810, partial [Gemmatimonadales bacterium]|nr:hypothetical protein [Gemmatimonadales bacterium]